MDPDFGWRLRTGQMILSSGIPKTDPFSYTMPSFPFVDHAWTLDFLIAILFPYLGYLGLGIICSLITTIALLISLKWEFCKKGIFFTSKIGLLFLAAGVFLNVVGVRVQVFTLLFFAVLVRIVFDKNLWMKWRFLLPLFFVLWSNTHGGFMAGIVTVVMVVLVRFVKERMIDIQDLLIVFLCIAGTFINPYQEGVWREVWLTMSDSKLRLRINEWMPLLFAPNFLGIAFIVFSVFFLIRYWRKIPPEETLVFVLFLLQAFLSQRHMALWAIVALPVTEKLIFNLYQEVKKIKFGVERFIKASRVFVVFCGFLFLTHFFLVSTDMSQIREEVYYPKRAVEFLKKNLPEGEVFSSYNWGGYLIWKLPEKKVFIDGRMPSWRRKEVRNEESRWALDDMERILSGELSFLEISSKYKIEVVLWPLNELMTTPTKTIKKIENFLKRFGWRKEEFDFIKSLENSGWRRVYKDKVSVIYVKN